MQQSSSVGSYEYQEKGEVVFDAVYIHAQILGQVLIEESAKRKENLIAPSCEFLLQGKSSHQLKLGISVLPFLTLRNANEIQHIESVLG